MSNRNPFWVRVTPGSAAQMRSSYQGSARSRRRDELIDLYEREFVESQEDVGITVLGTFRDVDRPDRFVWLRAFPDLEARTRSLTAFYEGPVWAEHGAAAGATMLDVSDARLMHPLGAPRVASTRPPLGTPPAGTLFTADFASTAPDAFLVLATLEAENTFPRLPIRTDPVRISFTARDAPPSPQVLRLTPTARSLIR